MEAQKRTRKPLMCTGYFAVKYRYRERGTGFRFRPTEVRGLFAQEYQFLTRPSSHTYDHNTLAAETEASLEQTGGASESDKPPGTQSTLAVRSAGIESALPSDGSRFGCDPRGSWLRTFLALSEPAPGSGSQYHLFGTAGEPAWVTIVFLGRLPADLQPEPEPLWPGDGHFCARRFRGSGFDLPGSGFQGEVFGAADGRDDRSS